MLERCGWRPTMQTFQAVEGGESFLRMLDEVRRGETVLVEMDGKMVARLSPEGPETLGAETEQERVDRAIAGIIALRKRVTPISVEEILSARDEGRR
jgi:antitoxin (DNA-binding transcriptional repressor) of toxin-antitoxin stability system